MKSTIKFFAIFLLLTSCVNQKVHYNLDVPDQHFKLSKKLNEISGLVTISDSVIAAVQDEKGVVYYLDANTGTIVDHFKFGKEADYEGITHHKKHFYVLRSDGRIFKIKSSKENKQFKFKQSKGFDFEGLCLDKANNRLLVACKTHGNKAEQDYLFVYSFSLDTDKYDKEPVFRIKRDRVNKRFKPSGIAIHPNGSIYVLSSFSKTLLVLSPEGSILNIVQLSEDLFQQAEGIAFNSKGDLFISNEKNKQDASLLVFKNQGSRNK